MTKTLLLIGTLALAGIASAKSYDMSLAETATAAGIQLSAGEYEVKIVGGDFALFTNLYTGKKILTPVKVQDSNRKFERTAIDSTNRNGEEQILGLELGGSKTVIELAE
jgi:hypothetical protein